MRRLTVLVPAIVILLLVAGGRERGAATPAITGYPNTIAATGDSITRAANSESIGDNVENSWATGTNGAVNSIYSRILAQNPVISGRRFNDAVSGARMVDLNGQALNAVTQLPDLVTVLMGANDVCTSSEASMTPVATFRAQFQQAMATLSSGLPDARLGVASIPDIYNLWAILKDNATARAFWGGFSICQSLLANPTSTAQADVDRRNNVRQRNIDFNTQLAEVCAQYVHCKFDGNAGFNTAFQPLHVSTIDYFHPSVAGQALAASTGAGLYDFSDAQAPVSSRSTTGAPGGMTVSLSATDNAGVSGIEYKLNGGAYQEYTSALTLAGGDTITYRAVDINGNTEASQDFTACTSTKWAVPAGDEDCDGFSNQVETDIGTSPLRSCPSGPGDDAWPLDNNISGVANVVDVLAYKGKTPHGIDATHPKRLDLTDDGTLNVADILKYKGLTPSACGP